jgi:hypothetical protein
VLFYDSGGPLLSYKNNESYTLTLKPKHLGNSLNANFLEFSIESHSTCSYDKLSIYNGLTTSSPLIGSYCGTNLPGIVSATNSDGALTFVFHSDVNTVGTGWKALVKSVGTASYKTISINVSSNTVPISNASVTIGGVIKTTDGSGIVNFSVVNGGVSLTVNALGYRTLSKIIAESETNTPININLEKLNSINIHVLDKKTLGSLAGVKVKAGIDSSYTNSLGRTAVNISSGINTMHFELAGFQTLTKQIMVDNNQDVEVSLDAVKYKVSFIVKDRQGFKLDRALISINDTLLTTNNNGLAYGYFPIGIYPTTLSKSKYFPISTWFSVEDSVTNSVVLEQILSLYNIEFTFIGDGPKGYVLLNKSDIDLYYNNILYSRITTDNQGKGYTELPKGYFIYNATCEGYNSIANKPFVVDGVLTQIKDTLVQKTFSVQFYVHNENNAIENATITLNGYSPTTTNSAGEASFLSIGYEKQLPYIVQRDGFENALGFIDVINPLVQDVYLALSNVPIITDKTRIYPNPITDRLTIESKRAISKVEIFNSLGLIVLEKEIPLSNTAYISFANQVPGPYILVLHHQNSKPEKILVIKK